MFHIAASAAETSTNKTENGLQEAACTKEIQPVVVEGHWQANHAGRDRCYYKLTPAGRRQLAPLRQEWRSFFEALDTLAGVSHA